jgi:gliding motility-associated-like protein
LYSVETTDGVCTYLDSTFVQFNPPTLISLGPDQTVCADSLELSIGAFAGIVNWSDGSAGNSNWVTGSGEYSVIAENTSGCLSYDTIDVVINPLPDLDLGPDQQLCIGDQIYLTAIGFSSVLWNDASTNDSLLVVSTSGNYSVTVSNLFSCVAADTVSITFNVPIQFWLGPDLTICDTEVLLSVSPAGGTILWSDGVIGNTNLITQSGSYSVVAEDLNGCISHDTAVVFLAPVPAPDLGADTLICPDEFFLFANGYSTVLWSDFSSGDSLEIVESGTYSVEVTNSFGCVGSDQVSIEIIDPTVIDLGPDFETCNQNEVVLNTGLEAGVFQWSTEQFSSSIVVTESGTYFVTQQVCGVSVMDSIRVDISILDQTVYIPNAFTPDGNQLNPVFEVVFGDYTHVISYQLVIYNRWGEVVFTTTDPYDTWNGTGTNGLVQDGVYAYVVKIETDCDGNQIWVKNGHVAVLK